MEKTLADIEADIAVLHANVAKYRQLAAKREAHGHTAMAKKPMELVVNLEVRATQLEAIAKSRTNPSKPARA
jgi:hypothetical protein